MGQEQSRSSEHSLKDTGKTNNTSICSSVDDSGLEDIEWDHSRLNDDSIKSNVRQTVSIRTRTSPWARWMSGSVSSVTQRLHAGHTVKLEDGRTGFTTPLSTVTLSLCRDNTGRLVPHKVYRAIVVLDEVDQWWISNAKKEGCEAYVMSVLDNMEKVY